MTVRDLDRLVSRTQMNPVSKNALKRVRQAVMSGTCGDPEIRSGSWAIALSTDSGSSVTMSFSFKRDTDGS